MLTNSSNDKTQQGSRRISSESHLNQFRHLQVQVAATVFVAVGLEHPAPTQAKITIKVMVCLQTSQRIAGNRDRASQNRPLDQLAAMLIQAILPERHLPAKMHPLL